VPTSRGVDLTAELCMSGRPTSYRVTRGALRSACFHAPQGLTYPTVPRSFRTGFILSCLVSSSEFLRRSSFSLLSEQSVLPGFRPSSRHRRRRPLARKHSRSRYVPPSGFLSLSTVFSASGVAGLSHPAATSRVSPSRGFSRSAAAPARHRPLPPCRCRPTTDRRTGHHDRAPRLRGFSPWTEAFSGVGG
jgi:hypothetical protein